MDVGRTSDIFNNCNHSEAKANTYILPLKMSTHADSASIYKVPFGGSIGGRKEAPAIPRLFVHGMIPQAKRLHFCKSGSF